MLRIILYDIANTSLLRRIGQCMSENVKIVGVVDSKIEHDCVRVWGGCRYTI